MAGLHHHDPFDIVQLYEFESPSHFKCGHTRVDRWDTRHEENEDKWGPGVSTPIGKPMYRWEAERLETMNQCDLDYEGEFDFGRRSSASGPSVAAVVAGAVVGGLVVGGLLAWLRDR